MFNYFDKKEDGLIDFAEFVESVSIIYKSDVILKARFVFDIIDFHKMKELGVREINKVFELAFVDVFVDLKAVHDYFVLLKTNKDKINTRDMFNNGQLMDQMNKSFDIVLDRNEGLKLYVCILEIVHGFDINKLQKLWDLYKIYFIKNYDNIKMKMQKKDTETREIETMLLHNLFRSSEYTEDEEASPFELTNQQFKIVMRELFKVQDVQLLDDLFANICGGKKYSKCRLDHFFESITFYFSCKFDVKISLVFEVYCAMRNTTEVPHDCIIDFVSSLFDSYWRCYEEAKKLIDDILDKQEIKFLNYKNLETSIVEHPHMLDSIFRLTLGKYHDMRMRQQDLDANYLSYGDEKDVTNKLKPEKTNAAGYKNWHVK